MKLQTNRQKIDFYQPTQRKSYAATQFMNIEYMHVQKLSCGAGLAVTKQFYLPLLAPLRSCYIDIMHIIYDVYGYIGLGVFASCNSRAVKHFQWA